MADKIMQKEIISDPFSSIVTNEEVSDTLQEFVSLQQVYEAGIKEIRTKLEILDDEFKVKHDHNRTVIDIEHNPFKGLVIAIRDKFNRIFFGEQKYFIPVNEDNVCMQ